MRVQLCFLVSLMLPLLVACGSHLPQSRSPASVPVLLTIEPQSTLDMIVPEGITSSPELAEFDQVIFTIPNDEPWWGREGDLRPDWKGWGAEIFRIAPDGTFWIADTAVHPNRLLQYNPQGELLQEVSLQDHVVYAYALAVNWDSIWMLDISVEPPQVVQMSLGGDFLTSVDIPKEIMTQEGMVIGNGAFDLIPGNEAILLLNTINGYYELVDDLGEFTFQPVDQLASNRHTYQIGRGVDATGKLPLSIDGVRCELSPDFIIGVESLLGFNPDGRFALAGYVLDSDNQADYQIRLYDARCNLLGIAHPYPQNFYKDWNHHLAYGLDNSVYQLLSNPDHSVQVLRLGFNDRIPAFTPTPPVKTHKLTAFQPIEGASTEQEEALNTLLDFFTNLSAGNYAAAAGLFGGEIDNYLRDPLPDESIEAYWEHLCMYLWCLPVAEITEVEQVSENEYLFYIVFMQPDGTRFEIGACCGGDPAATPPVWQFAYPVLNQDGVWKVMRAPLFTP